MTEKIIGVLPDFEIKRLCLERSMITPFVDHSVSEVTLIEHEQYTSPKKKVVSYGLSSFGYDVRLSHSFQIFTNVAGGVVDPKHPDPTQWVDIHAEICQIPPNGFIRASTLETFIIPKDICGECLGKSTYARCGVHVTVTPLEPGWRGTLTLEIHNGTPLPALVYGGEGICQIKFERAAARPDVTYADRDGKYQGQRGITPPIV